MGRSLRSIDATKAAGLRSFIGPEASLARLERVQAGQARGEKNRTQHREFNLIGPI
jgi:hypothetical protein